MGEQAAVKGRFDGLAAGGGVPGVPASDHLCGVENELFAFVCLLHKGCVRGWDPAEHVALSIFSAFFHFKIQNTSVQASFLSFCQQISTMYHFFVCCRLMEALLSTLAFRRVPTVERTRKRKKEEQDSEQVSRKRPKLLEDILSGENPPSLVPSYTSKGVK